VDDLKVRALERSSGIFNVVSLGSLELMRFPNKGLHELHASTLPRLRLVRVRASHRHRAPTAELRGEEWGGVITQLEE
jgi:hypothetical protein